MIVPAAGRGSRLKSKTPKPFVQVLGKPLFIHTLSALKNAYPFYEFVLAVDPDRILEAGDWVRRFNFGNVQIVPGGNTRAESVKLALEATSDKNGWVVVHDAARPLVSAQVVHQALKGAKKTGASVVAMPAHATVKRVQKQSLMVGCTENREELYLAQTPQVFRRDLLLARYRALGKKAFDRTDDAALFDGSSVKVQVVPGEAKNIKITTAEDMELFKYYLKKDS